MSFFKNIGKGIKKGLKQVSFKNLVKVGSMVDPTGLVGGLSSAHEAKKEAKAQEAMGNFEAAQNYHAIATQLAQNAGSTAGDYFTKTSVVQDVVNGAIGNAGANVADQSIKVFFTRHWAKMLAGAGLLTLVIFLFRKKGAKSKW
jgi:hypothetical protein